MNIPFADIKRQYQLHKNELDAAMAQVMADTAFVGGLSNKYISQFEQKFASYLGVAHCVSCANGTDSLEIIMKSLKIGPGDEVIVPAHSWISTSESVSSVGARPVFADTLPGVYTINPNDIERKITSRTKAIIPVHLYGQPAEMTAILNIAQAHHLYVIEDCAQAHGAVYKGQMTGTFGHAASYSFYPGKNLGAFGDAGAITTANDELAVQVRMIANHGQVKKHHHLTEGRNSRMDGLQAAILTAKLPYLPEWTYKRQKIAQQYGELLGNIPELTLPGSTPAGSHVYHLYVIQTPRRDELIRHLNQFGIGTAIHYPNALPFLDAYTDYNHSASDFPIVSSYISSILSLPLFPEMTDEEVTYVAQKINMFFKN